jgi:hypothetical protein
MAANSLAPGFIKLYYTSGGLEHVATLPVKPGFDVGGGNWELETYDGTFDDWETALDGYITVIKPLFHTSTIFTYAELWQQTDAESDPEFAAVTFPETPGTGAATVVGSMATFSLRTNAGGNGKIVLMSHNNTVNLRRLPPTWGGATTIEAVADYLVSASNFIFGRDGGKYVAATQYTTKTSDESRKRLNLV